MRVYVAEAESQTNDAGCVWEFLAGSSPLDYKYCPDSVARARMWVGDNYAHADVEIEMRRDPHDRTRWELRLLWLELKIGYDYDCPVTEPVVLADGYSPQDVTVPVTVEMRLEYPTRLVAVLEELDRTGWGRTWGQTGEIRDLRKYDACVMERFSWWPGGRVRVRVWGQDYTLEPQTPADKLPHGHLMITGYFRGRGFEQAPGRFVDYYGGTGVVTCRRIRSAGASPEMEPWQSTIRDEITWPHNLGELDIVRLTAAGDRLTGQLFNVGLETDLRLGMMFSPAREVTVEADFRDAAGRVLEERLELQPTGPPASAGNDYPQPRMDAVLQGPGSAQWSFRDYAIRGGYETWFWGPRHYHVVDEIRSDGEPVFAWTLSPQQLEAAGYEKNAWRCPALVPLQGVSWDYGYLYLVPSHTVDACNSLTPWTSSGTLSLAGGGIRCSGDAGRWMQRTFTVQQACWGSCRYLEIPANAAGAGRTGTLEIGGKTWSFASTAQETVLRFDLLAPGNLSGLDTTETLNESAYGWGWGVESPLSIRLTFDQADDWVIKSIRFVRESRRHILSQNEMLANLPAFRDRDAEEETYLRRILLFVSEGKVVADERLGKWNEERGEVAELRRLDDVIGAVSTEGLWGRLGSVGQLGIVPAFNNDYDAATRSRPASHDQWLDTLQTLDYYLPDQWANNGRWAYHMLPVVRVVRTVAGGENYEDAIPLPAHLQADYIQIGLNVTPVRLRIPRILGGLAHGILAEPGSGAVDNATIYVSDRGDQVWHAATTWRGYWRSPGLRQPGQHHVTLDPQASQHPASIGPVHHGRWPRVCLEGEGAPGEGISQWVSRTGYIYRAYGQGGSILLDRNGPSGWTPPRAVCAGAWPSLTGNESSRGRRLRLFYEYGGDILTRTSANDGEDWSAPVTSIANAGKPFALHDDTTGITYLAYRASDGSVKVAWSVDGGATFAEMHTAATSSDDDAVSLSIVIRQEGGKRVRRLILSYRTGGAVTAVQSDDNGRTWTTT